MPKIFRIFLQAEGGKQWVVLAWLIASGFAGGISFATLVPLVGLLTGEQATESNQATQIVQGILDFLGLRPSLASLLALAVLAVNLQALMIWVGMRQVGYAVTDVLFKTRSRLLNNLFASKWSFFSGIPLGTMTNSIVQESSAASQAYLLSATLSAQIVRGIMLITVSALISWKAALAALAIGALLVLVLSKQVRRSRKYGTRNLERGRELTGKLSDAPISAAFPVRR
jgi:ATP-binding cassette subfamily C protein